MGGEVEIMSIEPFFSEELGRFSWLDGDESEELKAI